MNVIVIVFVFVFVAVHNAIKPLASEVKVKLKRLDFQPQSRLLIVRSVEICVTRCGHLDVWRR